MTKTDTPIYESMVYDKENIAEQQEKNSTFQINVFRKVNIQVENNEFIYKYMIIFYSFSFLIPIYI